MKSTPGYYVKYKNPASFRKTLTDVKNVGVAEVTPIEREQVNMKRSVTEEHCFESEELTKQPERGEQQEKIKENMHIKQQLLKNIQ